MHERSNYVSSQRVNWCYIRVLDDKFCGIDIWQFHLFDADSLSEVQAHAGQHVSVTVSAVQQLASSTFSE